MPYWHLVVDGDTNTSSSFAVIEGISPLVNIEFKAKYQLHTMYILVGY